MLFKRKPLNSAQEKILTNAIVSAEKQTSGEIRVHFDTDKNDDPVARAKQLFVKFNMQKTEQRNGILFYVNLKQRLFAVWGDEGINSKVPEDFWDSIKDCCVTDFKQNRIVEGLEKAIEMCGQQLKKYFPYQSNDKNELPNDITYN